MSAPKTSPQRKTILELNHARWPVLEITNPIGFGDPQWELLIEDIVKVLKKDRPFAMINDVRVGPPPTASQRRAITQMYQEHLPLVHKNWKGTAIITNSALIKGAITALNWLMPPPHPAAVFSSYEEGEKWAFQQVGLPIVRSSSAATRSEALPSSTTSYS